jgi:hypothetical protein
MDLKPERAPNTLFLCLFLKSPAHKFATYSCPTQEVALDSKAKHQLKTFMALINKKHWAEPSSSPQKSWVENLKVLS